MVYISKSAIKCPSRSCDFAYFASYPDPAGKLRSHFNNLKNRDVEHEEYFQKPSCLFCGKIIVSKTRKGLWKSEMNKHWLIDHPDKFGESEVALILSVKQLETLCNDWQLNYELEEGDLIIRRGRSVQLHGDMAVARILGQNEALPSKRRRTCSQYKKSPTSFDPPTTVAEITSTKNVVCDKYELDKKTPGAGVYPPRISPSRTLDPCISSADDPDPADAFSAMTYCFSGFEDIAGTFEEPTQGAG
ncbi:unnamed protein product [Aspergillus oryzae]|uniref:Unnamed protein product n=1 Tax=Aspergillus oryzae TaxID=5062 RepID=A0AAN4YUL1_ASPOZ|nr:unnamed protein product [Aspergillus oryzae]